MKKLNSLNELISQAKKGKQQAQSQLISGFWVDVKYYILTKVHDENSAEELTVETFTKAITKLHLYNEDFDFKTWLISIAHNTTMDFFRKKKNYDEFFLNDYSKILQTSPSPEDNIISEQKNSALLKAINELEEKYKKVMELKFLEDKSIKEIAGILDLTEANVKIRILRGKKLLSDKLNT